MAQQIEAGDPKEAERKAVFSFPTLEPEIKCTIVYDDKEYPYLGRDTVKAWTKPNQDGIDSVMDLFKLALCYE